MSLELPIEQASIKAAAPVKLAKGTLGETKNFKTNVAKISLKPNIPIYKYDLSISLIYEGPNGKEVRKSLTKGPRNDCLAQSRTSISNIALKIAFDRNLSNFKDIDLFHDSQASLYSTLQIQDFIANIEPKDVVPNDEDCRSVEVQVKRVAESHQVSTNDTKRTVNSVFGKADVTLLEALNTMISQSLDNKDGIISYKGVHYALDPSLIGFVAKDLPTLPGGQYMGIGLAESVKTLEGEKQGSAEIHCIVDSKRSAFHSDYQNLIDKMESILQSSNENLKTRMVSSDPAAIFLKSKLKGLAVRLNYGRNKDMYGDARSFIIGGFAETPAEKFITFDGRKITVQEYFKKQFGVTLKYPNFFTVFDQKNPKAIFPPELLLIGENQRARTMQLTLEAQSELVKANAILPRIRDQQTKTLAEFVGVTGRNAKMEKIGIEIEKNNVIVKGRVLPTPNISTGDGIAMVSNNSKWNVAQFKNGVKIPKWTVISIDSNININIFLGNLRRRVVESGMGWVDPKVAVLRNDNQFDLESIISTEKSWGTKFLFFIVRDMLNLHQEIKLCEQKYDMLTQEVRATTAKNIVERGQAQTVANIVNKMNLKLGGVNWDIVGYKMTDPGSIKKPLQPTNFLDPRHARLIIGFESSRSVGDNLAVVGYSANALENSQNFVGNYKFVQNHSDIYGQVLKPSIHEMVRMFRQRRNRNPAHLYLYLNGISDSQMGLAANNYADRIKSAWLELEKFSNKDEKPHITIICVSKCPNERIMNENIDGPNAAKQNIPPGTCVDTGIVSPVINEFFLNSHSAFQGSARTPKFSQVFDTSKLPMDVHEGIAHQLCFMHGIVSSTISLPVPIMVADRCAKRGAANYQTSRRSENRSTISGHSGESMDLDAVNRELSYSDKDLLGYRFNA